MTKLNKKEIEKLVDSEKTPVKVASFQSFLEWLEFSYSGLILFWFWKGYGSRWCGLKYVPLEIKWFIQRITRGYSDDQLWNLNNYLGKHIIKVLTAFQEMKKSGVPCNYTEKNGKKISMNVAMKNWKKDIQDMIDGFDFLTNDDVHFDAMLDVYENDYKKAGKEYNKQALIAKKKAQKFIEHFNGLWD